MKDIDLMAELTQGTDQLGNNLGDIQRLISRIPNGVEVNHDLKELLMDNLVITSQLLKTLHNQ